MWRMSVSMGTDVACVDGRGWCHWLLGERGDVALFSGFGHGIGGIGKINKHTLAWPKHGDSPGARWWRWQPHVLVVVVGGGGGGEKKDGKVTMCDVGDVSTVVAQFGNSQAPIVN